ncbi:uncharacterized Rho GTPase-activating protein At5g61530 isoform X2 [Salvia hispanica]|uniref:uncharacterized Rho GTPase-activating protein At5g61530 isoform X2 n=1 Tax=Salvia hispanica TaxID=49212 RepID=UPI0020090403|nr:uncharacterized Rho GTPase-activating protein At5g61530 isoform X2 [Salvia hispanica]
MPSSPTSPLWQEKASDFIQSSGVKLKGAGHSAGAFVEEVAKDAKENVSDVAGKVGSAVKSRWAVLQQPSTRQSMQERLISAAATTSMILRKGISETKDKMAVGKTKVEEVAKKTAEKSKNLLTDFERWQKGVASTDVFGTPLELTVQHQESSAPIPCILMKCADFLILSGMASYLSGLLFNGLIIRVQRVDSLFCLRIMSSETYIMLKVWGFLKRKRLSSQELFKAQGNKKVLRQLVSLYNQDPNASLPEGINPVNTAELMKCYIASLPEPLIPFELYNDIINARFSIHLMRNTLKKLATVNYMTLELITALLHRVSQKSLLNKMDTRSLAVELAPIIMWHSGQRPEHYKQIWNQPEKCASKTNMDSASSNSVWEMLSDDEAEDASSSIPLDDGMAVDFHAIEAIQCLIGHHSAIFTESSEAVWR